MSKQSVNIEERFGLKRPNFVLDPIEDADFFAHRTGVIVEEIIENLRVDLATGLAPKRLFWGPYGGGKTHTLHKTMKELKKLIPIQPVYVECPDMAPRSTFLELYRDGIMRSLGRDLVLGLLDQARENVPLGRHNDIVTGLRNVIGDEDVAQVAVRLIDPGFKRIKLWAWISGIQMPRADLEDLNQTQDLTSAEPARLAEMVVLVGRLLWQLRGETLILILDEMDRLGVVGENTITTFRTGFTRLVDPNQKTVAVLIGCSAANIVGLPELFAVQPGNPIMSRLGNEARMPIPFLDQPDVKRFITEIIAYVRDEDRDVAQLCEAGRPSTSEHVEMDIFPFTTEALEALENAVGQEMTPREITLNMTHAAGRAHLMNKPVVTSEAIRVRA
jgi:hypothetical protein